MFCFELCSNSLWFECKFGYDLNDYELDELCRLFMRIMFMMLGFYDMHDLWFMVYGMILVWFELWFMVYGKERLLCYCGFNECYCEMNVIVDSMNAIVV